MIVVQLFFLILVILPASTSQQAAPQPPTVTSSKSKVEWTECGSRAKCICVETDPLKLKQQDRSVPRPSETTTEAEEGLCNIGVHIIFFDYESALYEFQVIGDTSDLVSNPELMLYKLSESGIETQLFGCKLNSGKVEVAGDAEILEKYEITLFEKRSYFEKGNVLCALKIKHASLLSEWIQRTFDLSQTLIKYLNQNEVAYIHEDKSNSLFRAQGSPRCDPYSFNDLSQSDKYHVQPITHRHRETLDCANYGTSSYTMIYDEKDKKGTEMLRLECKPIGRKYHYHIVYSDKMIPSPEDATKQIKEKADYPVINPALFTFYCAANIEETCENPNPDCHESDPTCPDYHAGSKGNRATLECKEKKWLIGGEYTELTADPVCKRDKLGSKNGAAFYFHLPTGQDEPQPGARCFSQYDCKVKSKLFLPKCLNETVCGAVDDSNGILKCKDATKQMTVNSMDDPPVTYNMSGYTCNPSTGMYLNGTVKLLQRSRVRCIGAPIPKKHVAADISDGEIIVYIGAAFVVVVVVIAAIFLAIFCTMKTAKKVRKGEKLQWMKMKSADRISRCKDDFENIMKANIKNPMIILAGLDRIELLLEAGIEDPECWEEVYKFLKRFQGALGNVERKLLSLFSRYMYIKAKDIIAQHKWTTTERITKKNQTGLMRSVAIRLLSFAMHDRHCTEAQQLIVAGYNELGFDAVDQYPHCGLMWSLIMHDRSGWFQHKARTEEPMRKFLARVFLGNLMKIAGEAKMVIPQEDIIPVFGTPVEQAAFAMGGSPNLCFHVEESSKILLKLNNSNQGAVPRSYLKGMGEVLHRTSMQVVLEVFDMWKTPNPKLLDQLWMIAPSKMWNEIIVNSAKGQIDYGLMLDAKKLHTRFIQSRPVQELLDVETEQKSFELAVDNVKEELRAWFATRTDNEELKKKPVYIVDPNLKPESRIDSEPPNVEPPNKDPTGSDNKSATPSSGGTTTNTEQAPKPTASDPPPPAPDAAAAPAAPAAAPQA